jgi:hypothetical protein
MIKLIKERLINIQKYIKNINILKSLELNNLISI